MTATLTKQAIDFGPDNYYDENLLQVYQDYKTFFLNHPKTAILAVESVVLYRNENDAYGLMLDLKIPPIYIWVVLMINNLFVGQPVPQGSLNIYLPDYAEVEKIRSAFESLKKIT